MLPVCAPAISVGGANHTGSLIRRPRVRAHAVSCSGAQGRTDTMKEKLTTEFVRRPPLQNVDVWDTKFRGLVLRCRASGSHTYRVNYGRNKWVTLGRADVLTPEA